MGYGIVLTLDMGQLDGTTDDDLARSLAEVLGTDEYPVSGTTPHGSGPWHVAGSYHSGATAELHLDGLCLVGGPGEELSLVSTTHSIGEAAQATKELMADPRRLALARARGATEADALFGHELLADAEVSLWWAYADALGEFRRAEPGLLGAAIRSAAHQRIGGTVSVGSWANALNCAGRARAGHATARWSGNRLWIE